MQKVYAIWSRHHATERKSGRDKIVATIKSSFENWPHKSVVFSSPLNSRSLRTELNIFLRYIAARLTNRPIALQLLLFDSRAEIERICKDIEIYKPDVVLVDTVRLIAVAEEIRHKFPKLPLILDMDDLMSRRYSELARASRSINLGVARKLIPRFISSALKGPIARFLYSSESRGLQDAERRAATIADTIVFVSPAEATMYRSTFSESCTAAVLAIIPSVSEINDPRPILQPYRFVHIGSDELIQNAETIRYLLDLWRRKSLASQLTIYGSMTKPWQPTENVTFAGFVSTLADIYTENTILLAPSFVKGGIKTKVIEAFGFSRPVIGTDTTFEGLLSSYPLCFTDIHCLESFLPDIEAHTARIHDAAGAGWRFADAHCRPSLYENQWQEILSRDRDNARLLPVSQASLL